MVAAKVPVRLIEHCRDHDTSPPAKVISKLVLNNRRQCYLCGTDLEHAKLRNHNSTFLFFSFGNRVVPISGVPLNDEHTAEVVSNPVSCPIRMEVVVVDEVCCENTNWTSAVLFINLVEVLVKVGDVHLDINTTGNARRKEVLPNPVHAIVDFVTGRDVIEGVRDAHVDAGVVVDNRVEDLPNGKMWREKRRCLELKGTVVSRVEYEACFLRERAKGIQKPRASRGVCKPSQQSLLLGSD